MRILVSARLLGMRVRYDGKSKPCEAVLRLMEEHERLGGLTYKSRTRAALRDQVPG